MTSRTTSSRLFDYSLSDTRTHPNSDSTVFRHGCEVITTHASQQLAAMMDQFHPDDAGWYVLLIEVPGFRAEEGTTFY